MSCSVRSRIGDGKTFKDITMKNKTLALSALALAASSAVFAQSSGPQVTLYGILDANVQVLDGAATQTRVQSGGLQGSRFGLRGSEDLGAGLKAFFTLESNDPDLPLAEIAREYGLETFRQYHARAERVQDESRAGAGALI